MYGDELHLGDREPEQAPEPVTVTWDGKDLAAVQMATAGLPRKHGEPYATVEQHGKDEKLPFRLMLGGVLVPVGTMISVSGRGVGVFWEVPGDC